MSIVEVTYIVGRCPACNNSISMRATIELDAPESRPPDPRQEKKVSLNGEITGASVIPHDCRKKLTR